jgi:hypothetical protein
VAQSSFMSWERSITYQNQSEFYFCQPEMIGKSPQRWKK